MTAVDAASKPLAAIVFADDEPINSVMSEFVERLVGSGLHVAGFVQIAAAGANGDGEAYVRDVETGTVLPIFQNLGRLTQSCRLDPGAIGEVGGCLRNALERNPDLLVVNRFGKLESEGKGLIDEIAIAATSGIPVLIGVAARYRDSWRQFAMGFDEELVCSREALESWWDRQAVPTMSAKAS